MKSILRRIINKLGRLTSESIFRDVISAQSVNSQVVQVLLMQHYKDMVRLNIRPLPTFDEVGFRCYSQLEEDGILLYIFSLIGVTNKIIVEICAEDGTECNATNLILNHGWQGFMFDGDKQKVQRGQQFFMNKKDTCICPPKFNHAWITAENVNEIIQNAGIKGDIDLLSIDIDGMDYWIWKAIECINPRVVVCETNNVIAADKAITVPYDPNFILKKDEYHGASLAAMTKLSAQKGYRLVGTHRYGFNAFYIRNDIDEDLLPPVQVADCLLHPFTIRMKESWPKIKELDWVEV